MTADDRVQTYNAQDYLSLGGSKDDNFDTLNACQMRNNRRDNKIAK